MKTDYNERERELLAARFAARTVALVVKLATGHVVPEYILCDKCGERLYISPNSKGAFSYQGCRCHEPERL